MPIFASAAMVLMAASALWTANDPFVGKWRLDAAKSVIVDQMVVEAAGPNTYTFRFEGGPPETVVADGRDQPGLPGTTLAIKVTGPRTLKVVRKQAGHTIVSANWTLSEDGRTLIDAFSGKQADGLTLNVDLFYRRMTKAPGFAGVWESTMPQPGLSLELQIQPYGDQGLSFVSPGSTKSVTFDGQDHAPPGAGAGATISGRRQSERALEYTDKRDGKVAFARRLQLSGDNRTLTLTVQPAGQVMPNVLVFERE